MRMVSRVEVSEDVSCGGRSDAHAHGHELWMRTYGQAFHSEGGADPLGANMANTGERERGLKARQMSGLCVVEQG